jgi:hypothetical protein
MRSSAGLLNIADNSLGAVLRTNIGNDDFGPSFSQPPCDGTANVSGTAGDQSYFAV